MGLLSKLFGSAPPSNPEFARVAVARQQAEGEFLLQLLKAAGIPAMYGRTRGFDVPDMLAAGPRDILVPFSLEAEAREVLAPVLDDEAEEPVD